MPSRNLSRTAQWTVPSGIPSRLRSSPLQTTDLLRHLGVLEHRQFRLRPQAVAEVKSPADAMRDPINQQNLRVSIQEESFVDIHDKLSNSNLKYSNALQIMGCGPQAVILSTRPTAGRVT
jgi:hypothetical protein